MLIADDKSGGESLEEEKGEDLVTQPQERKREEEREACLLTPRFSRHSMPAISPSLFAVSDGEKWRMSECRHGQMSAPPPRYLSFSLHPPPPPHPLHLAVELSVDIGASNHSDRPRLVARKEEETCGFKDSRVKQMGGFRCRSNTL